MYKTGDFVLYGGIGVCIITDIEESAVKIHWHTEQELLYYVLKPLYHSCTIFSPVSNPKVFMRPIINKEEAEEIIEMIPEIKAEIYHTRLIRQLSEHYEEALKTHSCIDWAKLTTSIYAKKKLLEQDKRKLGAIDEKYLKRAEELLYGELSAALGISRDKVPAYIAHRTLIQKETQRKNPAPMSIEAGLSQVL